MEERRFLLQPNLSGKCHQTPTKDTQKETNKKEEEREEEGLPRLVGNSHFLSSPHMSVH